MLSIKDNVTSELVVNKSKFITKLVYLDKLDDYKIILKNIKKDYPKANHYCYALIYDDYEKVSDDKEPSNTAGLPMLNILKHKNLNHVICVVVRYFGGIKLGVGGLIRAYNNSVVTAVDMAIFINIDKILLISINFNYDVKDDIELLLQHFKIIQKEYNETVFYQFEISNFEYDFIKDRLKLIVISIKEEIIYKKKISSI
ncbi:MAG: YigZ family protein [Bacilli bacterium]|nr:YigZ family protein [Bacilli bacterium]